jgi:hypothetical protein
MVDDARYRTKVFLDHATHGLQGANMLKDDALTELSFITAYGDPTYPMDRVFYDPKHVDVVFSIFTPDSEPLVDWDGVVYGYRERVPIHIYTVTKQGISGPKARWQAEAELRRIVETYPFGSYRSLQRIRDMDRDMGGWTLFGVEYILTYERDTT